MQLYFEIMGLRIPAYSTMALAGFLCALVVARKLAKNIMTYDFWCAISYGGIAMIAGAKLFYLGDCRDNLRNSRSVFLIVS